MGHDRFPKTGEVLARQDKAQEKLYLVLEGELQVSKNGQPIARVRAGDFAGEVMVAQVDSWAFFVVFFSKKSGSDVKKTHSSSIIFFFMVRFERQNDLVILSKLVWLHNQWVGNFTRARLWMGSFGRDQD